MAKEEIITTLELGSGKVSCAVTKKKDGVMHVLGMSDVHSKGLQSGTVVSIDETIASIQECIEIVEKNSGTSIDAVYLGIKGDHIETYNHKGALNISRSDKEIIDDDLQLVLESARQMRIPNDREIIETIPQGYIVDKQKGVPNPLGMEGSHLGVNVHLITALSMPLNNIYKCVNRAGFKIEGLAFSVLAAGEAVIMPEEKDLGVVLVDIGGHVTDIAIYTMGSVCYTKEVPVGGDYITRDIAYGLRTSIPRARSLKEHYGMAYPKQLEETENIPFLGVDGIIERTTSTHELSEIIYPRVEEILKIVKQEIMLTEYASFIPSGIVITGGTAKLKGIREVAEAIFEMPVRIGLPQGFEGANSSDPIYATALGLTKYIGRGEEQRTRKKKPLFANMKRMIEEIF